MTQLQDTPYTAPVFDKYSFNELYERTGYSIPYLHEVATGRTPITRLFRRKVSAALHTPESVLFGALEQEQEAS